jgi:hypothetical protein
MQRSWKSDFHLIIFTAIFLLLEVIWLLMHLQILPNPFKNKTVSQNQQPAGFVMKSQHELRKRGLNSLVWENSGADETLYYFDSILTLSQSTATLHLNEQTEVHLSENTLVTIEPPSESADSQIRLRFTRGDLRARNPYSSTRIETDQWSLNLNQGSEVSLRQTGKEDFEVEVLKGNLEFEKDSAKQNLGENQVLKIEKNQISETVSLSSDIKFEGPAKQRIYSYDNEARVPVKWSGSAEKIQVASLSGDSEVRNLNPQQTVDNLALSPGKYTLRLLKDGKVSEAKEIEIWKAPTLQLLSPFPRDRVKTNEQISFIWTHIPEAQDFKFIITDLATGKITEKTVKEHYFQYGFSDEHDVEWKVIGMDRDGFEMPSAYSNQIFPRHEPLAAPKLKSPQMRVPASKPPKPNSKPESKPSSSLGSPLFRFLAQLWIGTAHAASSENKDYEAVFAWEPVEGADLYTLEVSTTPDFRKPVLSKRVKRTEYIWSQFPLGVYYWRVASGTTGGRLGAFSEPAKVHLDQPQGNSANQDGVLIRKTAELEAQRTPVETKTEELLKVTPEVVADESRYQTDTTLVSEEQRQLQDTYLLEWTPVWTGWALNGENELKAKLNGSSLGAAHLQIEQAVSKDRSYFVDAFYAQYRWKVADPAIYPFQEEQPFVDARVQILMGDNKSSWLRGGIVQTVPTVRRKDLEKIEIKTAIAVGPSVTYIWNNSENWEGANQLSVMAGSAVFAISNQNQFRYKIFKGQSNSMSLGFRLQEDFVFDQRSFSTGWGAGLTLGFEH